MPPSLPTLTWSMMFGLMTAACTTGESSSSPRPEYPAGHPCETKGNCDTYLSLPDGGATDVPDGGSDAGTVRMCGPCNG